jgi:3-oxoacyl-[acyl-carrier protein] reductase
MDLGLTDRVYVVTGASRGLGRASAEVLVAEGARVVVAARQQDAVDEAVSALGERAVGVAADLGDPQTPDRLRGAAQDSFGRLDGALISVGGPPAASAMETTDDQWRQAFDSVFLGTVRLARELARALGEGGALAAVLSTSVTAPVTGLATSNGMRPGLAMTLKMMADELGPRGIRVNGLLPGRLDTDRVRELDAGSGDADATRSRHEESIPLRRYGDPAEFGRVAAFVLSPAASYLSGVMLPVDGGLSRPL